MCISLNFSHTHTVHKKKKKKKKIVGGIELYGHTYMLIVGQVRLFRLQRIKKLYAQEQAVVVGFKNCEN